MPLKSNRRPYLGGIALSEPAEVQGYEKKRGGLRAFALIENNKAEYINTCCKCQYDTKRCIAIKRNGDQCGYCALPKGGGFCGVHNKGGKVSLISLPKASKGSGLVKHSPLSMSQTSTGSGRKESSDASMSSFGNLSGTYGGTLSDFNEGRNVPVKRKSRSSSGSTGARKKQRSSVLEKLSFGDLNDAFYQSQPKSPRTKKTKKRKRSSDSDVSSTRARKKLMTKKKTSSGDSSLGNLSGMYGNGMYGSL